MYLIDFVLLIMMFSPAWLFLLYIEWLCYLDLISKISCSFEIFVNTIPFKWKCHILESIEDANNYIGEEVKHNPVEMPSKSGILTNVDNTGYCTIDKYYTAPYWQIIVYNKVFITI